DVLAMLDHRPDLDVPRVDLGDRARVVERDRDGDLRAAATQPGAVAVVARAVFADRGHGSGGFRAVRQRQVDLGLRLEAADVDLLWVHLRGDRLRHRRVVEDLRLGIGAELRAHRLDADLAGQHDDVAHVQLPG